MFEFITDLSESRLFPSKQAFEKWSDVDTTEIAYLYLCCLTILRHDKETEAWVRMTTRKAVREPSFKRWQVIAGDLYVFLYGIQQASDDNKLRFDKNRVIRWLRSMANDNVDEGETRRLLFRLRIDWKIDDHDIREIGRRCVDWLDMTNHERRLLMTRILMILRRKANKSDIRPFVERLARTRRLELHHIDETTSSASIAVAPSALGAGFDPSPDGWKRGVYPKPKKPLVIRRVPKS